MVVKAQVPIGGRGKTGGVRFADTPKEANAYNFLYIPVDEEGTITVVSNDSGMLMNCIDLIFREGMKVSAVLDLGGAQPPSGSRRPSGFCFPRREPRLCLSISSAESPAVTRWGRR